MDQVLELYRHGGVTLLVLLCMSITVLGIGLERSTAIGRFLRRMRREAEQIATALAAGELSRAQAINVTAPPHPATPIFGALLNSSSRSANALRRLQRRVARANKAGIWVIGTCAATAPFIGLFGTVLGVMGAFREIGAQGGGGFDVVSSGISEALVATAAGIIVGIEAMFFFNYLQTRGATLSAELRDTVEELSEGMELRGRPVLAAARSTPSEEPAANDA